MSNYDINSNPALVRRMIENEKKANSKYYEKYPDSLIPLFEQELRELGYEFEVPSQIKGFLPEREKIISPIATKYYREAKSDRDKSYFVCLITCRGDDEIIKELIEDFQKTNTENFLREMIGNQLRKAKSPKFIPDYLKIIQEPTYGAVIGHFTDLLASLKVEEAIPIFIKMLDEEKLRTHAICALGDYKREELRPYFERFENDKNSYWRKYARAALKKLEKQLEKRKNSS
ncbi:MAG: hypothetical protein BWY46_01589 [Firmicutes bacterium ADurb.Bin300]|nr:MAG: hypothetical protein BWY46_01589 [Firmicutes bacterium ADurb.Bin300]HOD01858.1 hypothetical protein [Clostridiales bacterium]